MTLLPWFKLFARDYLLDDRFFQLSPAAEGLLMRMLCLCWTDGYCPSDVATLAMKIRRRKTDVQRHLPALLTLFQKTEDGRLVYEELEQQRRRCVEISAVRRGAANAKWEYQRSSALPLQY